KNLKEGQDFLEENKKKQGVVTLPSGVQYEIVKEGTGAKPTEGDQVNVVYHGTLVDGTMFDSSRERGDTATFNVNGVVPGFKEALTLMNEGSSWKVYIPSELGYGERGAGGQIKPNSVIIFEIDLIKVNKQEPAEER
ncbi:MAG: FKBP-type peptidyl-prolyl cis-trans isomerase, partial [Bacteroidales bacterium]|nr:FKBP-type peptidyl-prolyl cis-trans isomerase [Bacteroidales bacterium]